MVLNDEQEEIIDPGNTNQYGDGRREIQHFFRSRRLSSTQIFRVTNKQKNYGGSCLR